MNVQVAGDPASTSPDSAREIAVTVSATPSNLAPTRRLSAMSPPFRVMERSSLRAAYSRAVTLETEVRDLVAGRAGTWGVYARHLGTGEVVAINADVVMPAQSSLKTGVLVVFERRGADGGTPPESGGTGGGDAPGRNHGGPPL